MSPFRMLKLGVLVVSGSEGPGPAGNSQSVTVLRREAHTGQVARVPGLLQYSGSTNASSRSGNSGGQQQVTMGSNSREPQPQGWQGQEPSLPCRSKVQR